MFDIQFTDRLKKRYPLSRIGLMLLVNIDNIDNLKILNNAKKETEKNIRDKYSSLSREEILSDYDTLKAYRSYYKKFKKSYHLQLQMESIAKKGKSFPEVNPLVDSCFLSEMNTFVLTASHDADKFVNVPLFDLSVENDEFVQINGKKIILKPDDIIMRDGDKTVCSIIYGQDNSTAVSYKTHKVFYVAYAPEGVREEIVYENLNFIKQLIMQFSPRAETELLKVLRLNDS